MKNILITGVSTGIGLATAQYFLARGHFVYGSLRKQADAEALQAQLGEQFYPLVFDVRDGVAIKAAAEKLQAHLGDRQLDALVNNAGVVISGPMQLVPVDDLAYQLDVNVLGLVRVTQAFLPMLGAQFPKRQQPGKVFNISSVSGEFGAPFLGPYCASKYAVEAISDSWRRELLIFGVDVVCIQPGPIRTPIWDKAIAETKSYPDSDYAVLLGGTRNTIRKSEASSIPPERVAKVIYRALEAGSPRARYIVAKNSWTYWLLFRLVPDKVVDYFVGRAFAKQMKKYG